MLDFIFNALDKDGGFTVAFNGASVPDDGYMVGGAVTPLQLCNLEITARRFQEFIDEHSELLNQASDYFFGGWVDKADGSVWLDVSQHFHSVADAITTAQMRKEIAIWDVEHSHEIRL